MLAGFLLVLLLGVPLLNEHLAWFCERLLQMLLDLGIWIGQLPHATIEGISWQEKGWWMLLLQLGLCALFMLAPKIRLAKGTSAKSMPFPAPVAG